MIKVGITGNIGSGKSTVCKIFETLGIPVYYADDRAKLLMHEDQKLVKGITDLFGDDAYDGAGQLNRKWIASKVFKDKPLLEKLNALVHPAVASDARNWFETMKNEAKAPYALKEAALLVESGSYKELDHLILVRAPMDLRLSRVMARDGSEPGAIEDRMKMQMPESEKAAYANFEISNAKDDLLITQVLKIHEKISGSGL